MIVGAGVAGVSAAHHLLSSSYVRDDEEYDVDDDDAGGGRGRRRRRNAPSPTSVTTTGTSEVRRPRILIVDAGLAPGEGQADRKSGTATMTTTTTKKTRDDVDGRRDDDVDDDDDGRTTTTTVGPAFSRVKMMTQIYTCTSAEFIKHHGTDGARRYLQATASGDDDDDDDNDDDGRTAGGRTGG